MQVSIVIPTCNRNELLVHAVRSSLQQREAIPAELEVIVVDNSAEGSAQGTIAEHFSEPCVRYIHEPRPGVSHARNTGVASATGRYVAFLDDDEKATPRWLSALLVHMENGAAAAFGPVQEYVDAQYEDIHDPIAIPIVHRQLDVSDGADVSDQYHYLGTGNSIFLRETCFLDDHPFSLEFNQGGGEDIHFLAQLRDRGITLVWAAEALVEEYVPPSRLTVRYQAKRRFRAGQGRTRVELKRPRIGAALALFWMAVGGAQMLGYSACYLVSLIRLSPSRKCLVKIAGGAGKILFFLKNTDNE